jgi:hypothetical protein
MGLSSTPETTLNILYKYKNEKDTRVSSEEKKKYQIEVHYLVFSPSEFLL